MNENKWYDSLDDLLKGSILPMQIYDPAAGTNETVEVITCVQISGGAAYENGMPKSLTIIRKLKDGTEYKATYTQSNVIEEGVK